MPRTSVRDRSDTRKLSHFYGCTIEPMAAGLDRSHRRDSNRAWCRSGWIGGLAEPAVS